MALQLTAMNGFNLLAPLKCSARATNSLPVPDSPVISTVESVLTMRIIRSKTIFMAGELPMMLLNSNRPWSCFRRYTFSERSCCFSRALATTILSSSKLTGLVM